MKTDNLLFYDNYQNLIRVRDAAAFTFLSLWKKIGTQKEGRVNTNLGSNAFFIFQLFRQGTAVNISGIKTRMRNKALNKKEGLLIKDLHDVSSLVYPLTSSFLASP